MKLIYCIHGTFNSGGMERIITDKANYLAGQGFEVSIVTTEQKGRKPFFTLSSSVRCYDLGINYEDENGSSFLKKSTSFLYKQRMHRQRMEELVFRVRPDIIISTFGNEVNFLTSLKDGSKKILEIHFSKFFRRQLQRKGIWKWVDAYRSRVDEKKVKAFDKFIVLTEEDKEYWNTDNIQVIPNFITGMPPCQYNPDTSRAIAVGRLSFQKGYSRMIRAWETVHRECPGWKLDIYGGGEEEEELKALIDRLNLNETITINPPTAYIGEEYGNSSLFLLSSRYEGFPMVLLEAMSYGLPIISFDCKCGPKDLITDGKDGILVKEGDVQAFAASIVSLIKDRERRKVLSENTRLKINNFTEERIMEKWTRLFNEII